jgi:hypothetical protein
MISLCSWTHDIEGDPLDHLAPTANALSSHPSLKNLILKINGPTHQIPGSTLPGLKIFKNLSTLSVACCGDIPRAYCSREIGAAIKASPGLVGLSILNFYLLEDYRRRVGKCAPLQRILQASSPELEDLELGHVPLSSMGIKEILSPKLQHLFVSTLPGARRIEFDWRGLWSALQESGIKLRVLKAQGSENAMDELFTYLLSYTGLQRLDISDLQMDGQEAEDQTGQRLWKEVVPRHQNSLATLCTYSRFESEWCYGPSAAATLQRCSSLRDLTLSARSVNSSWVEAKLSQAREHDKVEFYGLEEPYGALENCGVRPATNTVSWPSLSALQSFSTNSIIVLGMDALRS